MTKALLSFKLGPVQPFIEAARTLRDLWSGSYLLSWLMAHGMKALFDGKALKAGVTFVTPDADLATNPLLRAVVCGETGNDDATLACLPHTFAAEVPAAEAKALTKTVIAAVRTEWKVIADRVRTALGRTFEIADRDWAANWDAQIECYFELTCVALQLAEATPDWLPTLGVAEDASQDPDNALWGRQWNLQRSLLDAARMVRHVPPYSPNGRDGRHPVKCSLLGSFEQVGPADFRKSQAFWTAVSTPNWSGFSGTRLQPNDKLCAVSLVKRFAWAVYWSEKLCLKPATLRFTDTPTMAARKWLADEPTMNPDNLRDENDGKWNGQWLHWSRDDEGVKDGDPSRPPGLKARIDAKSADQKYRPPTYYALLHLDGDNMGEVFQGQVGKAFGYGITRFQEVTKRLSTFALTDVKRVVEGCRGELIYAGGDDVLAFLPTETAITCARELHDAFGKALPSATLSGGIAVVHWKEDLRFALGQVRAAEKKAKRVGTDHGGTGGKDALALTVCKRSGEHATAVMGWDETTSLQRLITEFVAGASDRWVYKLRDELETLKHLPLDAGRAETLRLVDRGEFANKQSFRGVIAALFDAYQEQMTRPERKWPAPEVLTGFVTLVQAASFLARGKE